MSRSPDDDNLLQDLQDSLAAAVQPAELGAELRDRMRSRTLELAREQPAEGTRTLRAAEAVWVEIAPFVTVAVSYIAAIHGTSLALTYITPVSRSRAAPPHSPPPSNPGRTMLPCTLGGVNKPSLRNVRNRCSAAVRASRVRSVRSASVIA